MQPEKQIENKKMEMRGEKRKDFPSAAKNKCREPEGNLPRAVEMRDFRDERRVFPAQEGESGAIYRRLRESNF